jgi:hypothetical protein
MSATKLAHEPGAIPPETRSGLAFAGWLLVAIALLAAAGAVVSRDDSGLFILVVLLAGGNAVYFIGPPFGREGKPAVAAVLLVFVAACAGLVFTVAEDGLIAVGVVYLSLVIAILAGARWPPPERAGVNWSVAGTIPAFLAVAAVIAQAIDSRALAFGLIALVFVVVMRLWTTAAARYTGRR